MKRKKSDTGVQRKSAKVHASTLIGAERDHSPQDAANMPVQLILCCWDLCCQTDSFTWYFPPIQTVSSRCFTDSGRESRIRTRRRKSPPMDIRDGDGGNHPFSSCALGSCQWQALGAGTGNVCAICSCSAHLVTFCHCSGRFFVSNCLPCQCSDRIHP